MEIIKTPIEGLLVIEPRVFRDARGYFVETYNEQRYREAGIDAQFVQDNQSCSSYGVVRGLHFQKPPYAQAKLVCCTVGRVLDVAVDLRPESPTFGQWFGVELSEENKRQFFIPKGFAHGFSVLSESAIFTYKCVDLHRCCLVLFRLVYVSIGRTIDDKVDGVRVDKSRNSLTIGNIQFLHIREEIPMLFMRGTQYAHLIAQLAITSCYEYIHRM